MSPHPARLVWELAGRPDPPAPLPAAGGVCALCAAEGATVGALGANYTDYRTLARPDSTRLCAACAWTLGGKPPRTLRMWTVVARADAPAPPSQPGAYVSGTHLHLTNRRDLTWVTATLLAPPPAGTPWLAAVAESGQKHVTPFAPVNPGGPGGWLVRMDATVVASHPGELREVLGHALELAAAGIGRDAIETGRPAMVALRTPERLAAWRAHAPPLAAYAGSPLLHLATHLLTRDTLEATRALTAHAG